MSLLHRAFDTSDSNGFRQDVCVDLRETSTQARRSFAQMSLYCERKSAVVRRILFPQNDYYQSWVTHRLAQDEALQFPYFHFK